MNIDFAITRGHGLLTRAAQRDPADPGVGARFEGGVYTVGCATLRSQRPITSLHISFHMKPTYRDPSINEA